MNENLDELRNYILQFGSRAIESFKEEDVGGLTPQKTDNYLSAISGYSGMLEERLGELEVQRAVDYPEFRARNKSNADATREWESTPAGLEMIKLKRTLNATDKIIRACRDRLQRFNNEAHNKY